MTEDAKLAICLKEWDRVVWEIHNRVEYRQRLIQLEIQLLATFVALAAAAATYFAAKSDPDHQWFALVMLILPCVSILFSILFFEISAQDYFRFKAAQYLSRYLRLVLHKHAGVEIIYWEEHLRANSTCSPADSFAMSLRPSRLHERPSFVAWVFRRDTIMADFLISLIGQFIPLLVFLLSFDDLRGHLIGLFDQATYAAKGTDAIDAFSVFCFCIAVCLVFGSWMSRYRIYQIGTAIAGKGDPEAFINAVKALELTKPSHAVRGQGVDNA